MKNPESETLRLDQLHARRSQLNHSIYDLECVRFGLGSGASSDELRALREELDEVEDEIVVLEASLERRDLP